MLLKSHVLVRPQPEPRHKWLTISLSAVALVLLVGNLFAIYLNAVLHQQYGFVWRFYFDKRANYPFFFSLILLFINLYLIYKIVKALPTDQSQLVFWKVLGVVFML